MTIEGVRNPKWINADHTCIECEVLLDGVWTPFGAVGSGDLPHVHEVFARCVSGDFGAVAEFIAPPLKVKVSNLIVSPRQIRQALTAAGYREVVELSVANGTQELKDWWEYATQFEENHATVVAMGANLGLTDAQRHDLFVLAGSL